MPKDNYNVYYLLTYRVYGDSVVVKNLTDGWFGIVPREDWNGKKVFILTGEAYRADWGFRINIIKRDQPKFSKRALKIFNELKRRIELRAELFDIIEKLKILAKEKFYSEELEDLLNDFWNAEEYAIYEGYKRKNAWILWFIKKYGIDFSDIVEWHGFSEWGGLRKLTIRFNEKKLDARKRWLLLRMMFRYKKYGERRNRMEITEEHIVNHWPAISVLFPQLIDFIAAKFPVAVEKIPKIWGHFYTWNVDLPMKTSPPILTKTLRKTKADFLIEVDLPRLVYYGVLGQAFEKWDARGYPRRVYYFIRDSPLSFDIAPGDLVLAKLKMRWGSETYVLEPLEKITLKKALQIIESNKDIRVVAFDKPLDLYKKLLKGGIKVVNDVLNELENREPILDMKGYALVAMKIRQLINNLQRREVNEKFDLLRKKIEIDDVNSAVDIFSVLMADKAYYLRSIGLTNEEIFKIIKNIISDKTSYSEFEKSFIDEAKKLLEEIILKNIHREWNVKRLAEIFPDIAIRLVKSRIREIKDAEIMVEWVNNNKYYNISKLVRTYYGQKIVRALFKGSVERITSQRYRRLKLVLDELISHLE